jgi:hypothetical protein
VIIWLKRSLARLPIEPALESAPVGGELAVGAGLGVGLCDGAGFGYGEGVGVGKAIGVGVGVGVGEQLDSQNVCAEAG